MRTTSPIAGFGAHAPESPRPLRVSRSRTGRILHYHCVTFEDWVRNCKRRCDETPRWQGRRAPRVEHLRPFVQCYREGDEPGLRALHARAHAIPPREQRRLLRLGLLRRVHLAPELFLRP